MVRKREGLNGRRIESEPDPNNDTGPVDSGLMALGASRAQSEAESVIIRDTSLVDVSLDAAATAVLGHGPDPVVDVRLGTPRPRDEDSDRVDGGDGGAVLRVHLGQLVRHIQNAQVHVTWSMPPGLEYFDGLSGELEMADEGTACTKLTLSVTCAPDLTEPSRADIRRSLQEISEATLRTIAGTVGATTSW